MERIFCYVLAVTNLCSEALTVCGYSNSSTWKQYIFLKTEQNTKDKVSMCVYVSANIQMHIAN